MTHTGTLSQRSARAESWGFGLVGVLAAIALWEVASLSGVLPPDQFPPPSTVFPTWAELLGLGGYWTLVWQTLQSWFLGLLLAAVIGIPFGVLLGSNARANQFFKVVVEVLRPIPPVAIIPIALLLLGATLGMKLFLIAFGALWPIVLQTVDGVRGVDPVALETARSFRLSGTQRFLNVRLSGAMPLILTGVRVSASMALVIAIVAEMVGGAPGLGNEMLKAQNSNRTTVLYALILTAGALGMVVNLVFRKFERKLLFWHPSMRTGT